MKVLMISGDKKVLEQGADACARLQLQRAQVEQLDVFVWPQVHSFREIFRAARSTHYDVVTVQDPFWRGLVARRAARISGARLNAQVHTDLAAQPWVRHALARTVLRRADSIRVVSEKLKQQVESMGVRVPIHVLPIYIDISRFQTIVREPHPQKTILWIGRFEPEKDPLYAVHVLKEVRTKGIDVKLVMLGKGSLEDSLRTRAQGLPVEFPGWQDPAVYLAQADVVLSTSKHESYGASMIEALAAGVPVVAPDVGIAKEAGAIICDKENVTQEIIKVLRSGTRGVLTLPVLSEVAWAQKWKETLL